MPARLLEGQDHHMLLAAWLSGQECPQVRLETTSSSVCNPLLRPWYCVKMTVLEISDRRSAFLNDLEKAGSFIRLIESA